MIVKQKNENAPNIVPESGLDIVNSLKSKLKDASEKMGYANIIITGKTGVGKSTLINSVFRENLAITGSGRPITQQTKVIEKSGLPLRIYDTKGLELGKGTQEEIKSDIFNIIDDKLACGNKDEFIHAIWYCINTTSDRVEDEEINWIKKLTEQKNHNVPVILVLTKTISKKKGIELKEYIESQNINVSGIIPVLSSDYEIEFDDEVKSVKSFGLDKLVDVTLEVIPDSAKDAFINSQSVNLNLKIKRAKKWMAGFVAGNFATGFVPIPFADAPVLVASQVTMLARITVIFGIDMDKATITAIVTALAGCSGATIAGKTIVSNLLKLIPGVGTVVGGLISGGTASLLTTALGEAYIVILSKIARGEINRDSITNAQLIEEMKSEFKEKLKKAK